MRNSPWSPFSLVLCTIPLWFVALGTVVWLEDGRLVTSMQCVLAAGVIGFVLQCLDIGARSRGS